MFPLPRVSDGETIVHAAVSRENTSTSLTYLGSEGASAVMLALPTDGGTGGKLLSK